MSEWQTAAVVLAFIAWFTSPPAGLGDVARREALRRQITAKATRTLTNQDVSAVPPRALPSLGSGASAGPAGDQSAKAEGADKGEKADKAGSESSAASKSASHDEGWWRGEMTAARTALDRDLMLSDALQTRINSLTNEASARDDPAQRGLLYSDRARTVAELENMKKQVEADRKSISDLQDDARKQGVPSAWVK